VTSPVQFYFYSSNRGKFLHQTSCKTKVSTKISFMAIQTFLTNMYWTMCYMTFHIYDDLSTAEIGMCSITYIFQSQTFVSKFVNYTHTHTHIHTCASIFTHILDSKVGQYDHSFKIRSTQGSTKHDRQCRDNHYHTKHADTQNRL